MGSGVFNAGMFSNPEALVLSGIKNMNVALESGFQKREVTDHEQEETQETSGIKNINVELEDGFNKRAQMQQMVMAGIKNMNVQYEPGFNAAKWNTMTAELGELLSSAK